MPFPNQDYSKRDYLLPSGCKDLTDAIKHEEASVSPPVLDPPITRQISLPEVISVQYLADISGVSLHTMTTLMDEMRVGVNVGRSVDFEVAAKILLKYGIAAKRAA
jgi:hypothetical protein